MVVRDGGRASESKPRDTAFLLRASEAERDASEVKSQELLPKYTEQDAKQGPSSQFARRAGNGLLACPSSKELRGLGVCVQVRA